MDPQTDLNFTVLGAVPINAREVGGALQVNWLTACCVLKNANLQIKRRE